MSESWIEHEVRAVLEDAYSPAPWLLARSMAAVRGARPRRHTWAWTAGIAAVLIAATSIAVFESVRPTQTSPNANYPTAPTSPVPFNGPPPTISTAPDPRSLAAVAYDPLTQETVMFSGLPPWGGSLADTWTWDGSAWTLQHPGVSPHSRFGAVMAFDPALGGVVLIGGSPNGPTDAAVDADMRSMWLWRAGTWQVVTTAHTPVPQNYFFGWNAFMAFDGTSNELVLTSVTSMPHVGACSADTWTFDGHDWRQRSPAEALPATVRVLVADGPSGHVLAVLNPRPALVQQGFFTPACGSDTHAARALPSSSTWGWTGSTWTELATGNPTASGPAGDAGGTTFGSHAALVADNGRVWTWTGSAWLESQTAGPPLRSLAAVAEDRDGRLVMFGGILQAPPWDLGDSWLWDGHRWEKVLFVGRASSASR